MDYVGSCFCGAVKIEVTGSPEAMGYCHCNSCRSWSGGPVNAFSLWKSDAVQIKSGAEHVATFQKTPFSRRTYCKLCGGHLMNGHQPVGLIDVFAATIPTLKFAPGRSRQLCGDGPADEGRTTQAERLSSRVGRLWRIAAGMTAD